MAGLPIPPKGIVRLDYEPSRIGWAARYMRERVPFSKVFKDSTYGSPEAALAEAIEWRKRAEELFPPMNRQEYSELKRRNNSSGHTGVTRYVEHYKGTQRHYWKATWSPAKGKSRTRTFSINKHGEDGAKQMAIEARAKAIAELDTEWPDGSWQTKRTRDLELNFALDIFAFEGTIKYQIHKDKERNRTIRAQKIDAFLAEHGDLFCEICGFSFEQKYGLLGRGLIEVHHLLPVTEMTENHKTTLEELLCVCSNCHLVLHNGDPTEVLSQLRFITSMQQSPRRSRTHRQQVAGE